MVQQGRHAAAAVGGDDRQVRGQGLEDDGRHAFIVRGQQQDVEGRQLGGRLGDIALEDHPALKPEVLGEVLQLGALGPVADYRQRVVLLGAAREAEFVMGYGDLTETKIEEGVKRIARVLGV